MIRTYKKLIETTTEASWPMSNIDGNVGSTGFNSVLFQFLSHPIESGNVWECLGSLAAPDSLGQESDLRLSASSASHPSSEKQIGQIR